MAVAHTPEIDELRELVLQNRFIREILELAPRLGLPHWYLAGHCVAQTIRNARASCPPLQNIKDYQLVYFDSSDCSQETEEEAEWFAEFVIKDIPANLHVKNLARGGYASIEEAIRAIQPSDDAIAIRSSSSGDFEFIWYR